MSGAVQTSSGRVPRDLFAWSDQRREAVSDPAPDRPGRRGTDTSAGAGDAAAARGPLVRERCLKHITATPSTADETADALNLNVLFARPEISYLRREGKVRDSKVRRKNASGLPAIVWEAGCEPDAWFEKRNV